MQTPKNILKHELIGLEVDVAESLNKSQIGLKGKLVDETQKTIVIETKRGEKRVQKHGAKFIFKLPDGRKVKVDGSLMARRPEDRIKIKLKQWK